MDNNTKQTEEKTMSNPIILSSGQVITNFHPPGSCLGEHCPVHKPSDHPYKDEPLFFNGVHMVRRIGTDVVIDPDDYLFNRDGHAILKNSVKCLECGSTITSTSRHDFQQCHCENVFIDGGYTYLRMGAKDPSKVEVLSEEVHKHA